LHLRFSGGWGARPLPPPIHRRTRGASVRGRALGIAGHVTGAVFGDRRGRCSFGQRAHGARAHGLVREDQETSGQTMWRQPHLSACQAGCRAVRISQLWSTVNARQTRVARCGGHLNIAQIMRGQRPARPQARTVGDVRARETRSITRSRMFVAPRHETNCA
jgi:hypothetical protein